MANANNTTDDVIVLNEEGAKFGRAMLIAGLVLIAVGVGVGLSFDTRGLKGLLHSYLIAFMYVLRLGLGLLWIVIIQHLSKARWSVVVRRVAEVLAAGLPIVCALGLGIIIPMWLHNADLYIWVDHELVQNDHLLHHKAPYLNVSFFTVRCAVYFAFWGGLSTFFLKTSVRQDETGKAELSGLMHGVSAPAMILFAITLTFASIDFLMSLDPTWFSTMFGVYYFAGCIMSGHALWALSLMWLQSHGHITTSVTAEHYQDIGKMMFGFVVFWAYVGFSQFMLIWYADIPEETHWYHWRFEEPWKQVSIALLIGHFVLPFLGLMSRWVKRKKVSLAFWCIWLLIVQYIDMFWLVYPNGEAADRVPPSALVDLTLAAGMVALFLGSAIRRAAGINLIPTKDPALSDSLAFHNI